MKFNLTISGIILLLILTFSCSRSVQTTKYSAEVEEKIRLVENSLAGWVQTGEKDIWNLEERMKKYNINGVSIAVIHDYQVEWGRGYGFADVSENRPVTALTFYQVGTLANMTLTEQM